LGEIKWPIVAEICWYTFARDLTTGSGPGRLKSGAISNQISSMIVQQFPFEGQFSKQKG